MDAPLYPPATVYVAPARIPYAVDTYNSAINTLMAIPEANYVTLRAMSEEVKETIEGDGYRWINQIHRDDAVEAFVRVADKKAFGVYNVSDNFPIPQVTLYQFLAKQFDRPIPPFTANRVERRKPRASPAATAWCWSTCRW